MGLTRVVGWLLIFLGLTIIIYSLFSSYQVFTGKRLLPEIFRLEATANKTTNLSSKINQLIPGLDDQINQILGSQINQILPLDSLPKLMNLVSWSILAGILIFGGSQIAGLGIKLLK